ncbi:hypothetical protein ACFL6D_04605, partial [Spirochaetota bacterium]
RYEKTFRRQPTVRILSMSISEIIKEAEQAVRIKDWEYALTIVKEGLLKDADNKKLFKILNQIRDRKK